jgi:glucokinase
MAGVVSTLDPERIVVGGGVSTVGELLLVPAARAMRQALQAADRRTVPTLVPTVFGSEAGAIGAALLAREARRPR